MGTKTNTIENVPVATFMTSMGNGSAIKPLRELTCAITPTQNLNGYSKPWPGGAGKNLIDDSKRVFVKAGNVLYIGVEATTLSVPLKAGEYTASAFFDYACRLYYRPIGGDAILLFNNATTHSGTFTISEDGDYQFTFYKNPQSEGELDPEQIGHVQIEAGATSTAWEPYENICPITGQMSVSVRTAGRNLLAPATPGTTVRYGVTVENRTDGSVSFSGSATKAVSFAFSQAIMPPGTYKYTAKGSTTGSEGDATLYLRNLDTASTIISMWLSAAQTETRTFTLSKPTLVSHYIVVQNGVTVSGDLYPMILLDGESNDDYEPYQGQVATVQLGQEVYGGTIDVVSGTLTMTHRMVTVDQNTSSLNVGTNITTGLYYCESHPISEADAGINTTSGGGLLCDRFNVNTMVAIGNTYLTGYGKTLVFVLPDQTIDTVEKARVWLTSNPITWVYELAEPKTVQLTGQQINTLMGRNNVWASTGEIKKLVWVSMTYDLLQVFINGVDITELIAFNGWERQRNDVDSPDAGRTLDGRMHRARVATKMRFNVTCRPLLSGEISTLESLIMPEYVTVKVIGDPYFGTWEKLCYVNNTSAKYLIRKKDGRQYWGGITFPIIEV